MQHISLRISSPCQQRRLKGAEILYGPWKKNSEGDIAERGTAGKNDKLVQQFREAELCLGETELGCGLDGISPFSFPAC